MNIKLGLLRQGQVYIYENEKPYLPSDGKLLPVNHKFSRVADTYKGIANVYDIFVVCAIVNVTKNFDPYENEKTIYIDSETDSYQIRPKLIYKDKKGYYYKPFGKVVRLSEDEYEKVNDFIKINKNGI